MATHTVTLSRLYGNLATYSASSVKFVADSTGHGYYNPGFIEIPKWNSGRKAFRGYYINGKELVWSSGVVSGPTISSNKNATEEWANLADGAIVYDGTNAVAELAYDGGVWISDYETRTPLDASHPFVAPKKELYRFVGCYSTNGTEGVKYIDADGTPTDAILALVPPQGSDANIYAVYEPASVKITISSSYGDYDAKAFYQSVTADGDGKFGYFKDSACTPESRIYGIQVPTRELYAWGGLRKSSSSTSELWANADGTFTDAFLDRPAAAVTAYGNFWTQVSYKIAVNANGGVAPVSAYYTDKTNGGIFADWLVATPELNALPIPAYAGRRFLGYFNSTTGTTEYASYDGTVANALKTRKAATTIYAKWRAANATVTLDAGGGTGGGSIYFDSTDGRFFDATSATIMSVGVPEYYGNTFVGYFDSQDGGNRIIDANGVISTSYAPTGSDTLYAHYEIGKSTIDVDSGDGSGGTARFFYDHSSGKFFSDPEMTDEIASVALPSLRLFDCNGLFGESPGGTAVVESSGAISQAWHPSDEFVTVYAQYSRRCYEVVLDPSGGASEYEALYHAPDESGEWYSDESLTEPVANVGVPELKGHSFGGYVYGGTTVVDDGGYILPSAYTQEDYVATAKWTARTFTLTFDPSGGSATFASKTVTYGVAIGELPKATKKGSRFVAWTVGGKEISRFDPYEIDGDATAFATYDNTFGSVTDYFGFGSSSLVPESSESGEERPRVVSHNGTSEVPPSSGGDVVWMNPSVTYQVVGNTSLSTALGRAYAGQYRTTGYMITSVSVSSSIATPTRVTVTAVANEGRDAIELYPVSFSVSCRHRPQDVCGALNLDGYDLQDVTTVFSCDPVVVTENGSPCASDVCHGAVETRAVLADYGGGRSFGAGGGFAITKSQVSMSGTGYKKVSVEARKDLA